MKLKKIAELINKKEKRFGAMTYSGGKITRQSLEAHVIGMVAELAVAHYFDIDRRIFEDHGDDGQDLFLPHYGITQVKSTTYWKDPWLRAEVKHDHEEIQTYMLACVNPHNYNRIELIGQLPRNEVIKLPKKKMQS